MKRFSKSLGYALKGFKKAYDEEPNFRIHIIAGSSVLVVSAFLQLNRYEWIAIIVAITFVMALEIVNSIFERVIDMVKPSVNQYVKDMKDMMAASVLLVAVTAIIVGCIIFIPKIVDILG